MKINRGIRPLFRLFFFHKHSFVCIIIFQLQMNPAITDVKGPLKFICDMV